MRFRHSHDSPDFDCDQRLKPATEYGDDHYLQVEFTEQKDQLFSESDGYCFTPIE